MTTGAATVTATVTAKLRAIGCASGMESATPDLDHRAVDAIEKNSVGVAAHSGVSEWKHCGIAWDGWVER